MQKIIIKLALIFLIGSQIFCEEIAADSLKTDTPRITMIELGSTTCVPCKMMEPVMESLKEKYGDQLEVVFIDVKKNKEKATEWKIRMIPTQIFLNAQKEEIHRHVGFYSEELIDEFLVDNGLKKISEEGDQK